MQLHFLKGKSNSTWQNNKPFLLFSLSLVLLLSFIKIIFYNYNYTLLFANSANDINYHAKLSMISWSLFYELLIVLLINIPLLLLLQVGSMFKNIVFNKLVLFIFFLLNTFIVLINAVDILYYRFHLQRANADLLYVLDNPLKKIFHQGFFIVCFFTIICISIIYVIFKIHKRLYIGFSKGQNAFTVSIISLVLFIILIFNRNILVKKILPSYPLVSLNTNQLPVVQNSFHTFVYSLFRKGQYVPLKNYFSAAVCDSLFPIKKQLLITNYSTHKNIVLFIMESVAYDFFDAKSPYKVAMPFFDSILLKSSFYNNAYSYALESNKGIVAVLAGTPTITEIPLYHSQFVNMPITHIGTALKENNYHSFFCIGDDYDNFGFAKCANWLGIDKYYSREDMAEFADKPAHTMGMQDQFTLDFMHRKINEQQLPFFAIHYNISTHYPYDLPSSFQKQFPANYTDAMKAMSYYDYSLQSFFEKSKSEPWFKNTIYIFCSDHWMFPGKTEMSFPHHTNCFKIPIIIYDPSKNERKINNALVSQFDVLGTILGISGYKNEVVSYGENLLDSMTTENNKVVFSKMGADLYQIIDSSYVLGYNIAVEKAEYLYNYKIDTALKNNLIANTNLYAKREDVLLKIKAFLQKITMQYNRNSFK